MAFTGPPEDRLAIRELYGSYSDATAQADRDGWLSCWNEDCRWTSPTFDHAGKPGLAAQWDSLWQHYKRFAFYAELGATVVTGDHATARATTREIAWLKDGTIQKFAGRYEDELRRESGVWRFAHRRFTLLIAG